MNFNLLCQIVTELQPQLAGARIGKIHQPDAEVLVLRLWTGTANLRLLISVKPGQQRLHLTEGEWLNPHQPPRFCQLLRARIQRIDQVQVVNEDRVVRFDCRGPKGICSLIVELTGTGGNMILIDQEDIIIDVLKRDPGQESGRPLRAGQGYRYPRQPEMPIDRAEVLPQLPQEFASWSSYLDAPTAAQAVGASPQGIQQQLRQAILRQQKKLERRLEKIRSDLSLQQQAQEDRIKGDLLLANLHVMHKGMECLRVENFFVPAPTVIDIPLDSRLSPQENAQSYFKKYKKGARGVEHSRRREEETQWELQWLAELLYQLEDRAEPADLEAIHAELTDDGLLRGSGDHHKKPTRRPNTPQELVSPSGIKVLRGRNNRHNDQLSGQQLKSGDLWFHAHNCPGAHVVLKSSTTSQPPTDADIAFAAAIAAGFSRARHDAKVEVMMAQAEDVKRPKGAPAGLVTVRKYKTLVVAPLRAE